MKVNILLFKNKNLYGIAMLFLLTMIYSILLFLSPQEAKSFTREDGIIETFSAVFFSLASIIFFYLFFKSKSDGEKYFLNTRRNYFFLLLGLLMFICFSEEISWGQRILGLETPDYFQKYNAQREINIHNLYLFNGAGKNQNIKTGLELWMTGARFFFLFWLFYCFLIPIVSTFSSRVSNFLSKIHFPVIPLWIGILFPLNHIIAKLFEKMELFAINTPIVEIKETNFAFLYFVASISLYVIYKNDAGLANY